MGDLFDNFGEKPKNQDADLDKLTEYEVYYQSQLREYKPEIEFIQQELKSLREERKKFYEIEINHIYDVLTKDEVAPACKEEWIKRLRENIENSFSISEKLLNEFIMKDLENFQKEAERILRSR